jgi:hypothetical protein
MIKGYFEIENKIIEVFIMFLDKNKLKFEF